VATTTTPARKRTGPGRERGAQTAEPIDAAQSAALEELLTRGRDEGFITHDQILEAVPQPEEHLGAVEDLYAAAE
jgi:hypothetical protein